MILYFMLEVIITLTLTATVLQAKDDALSCRDMGKLVDDLLAASSRVLQHRATAALPCNELLSSSSAS